MQQALLPVDMSNFKQKSINIIKNESLMHKFGSGEI